MDWIVKKAKEEQEIAQKRRDQAYTKIPAKYHEFIVLLAQNKKIGEAKDTVLPAEAKRLGVWQSRDGAIFVPIELPYFTVDGRIQMARDEHKEQGKRLDIETYYDPNTKLFTCKVVSELYGTATAHAIVNFGGKGVDSTNPVENAETSAVGRALGNLAYGLLGTGIATYEEVAAATVEQRRLESQRVPEPESSSQHEMPASSSPQSTPQNTPQKEQPTSAEEPPKNDQQHSTTQKVGAENYEGVVTIKSIQFDESPTGKGLLAKLDVFDMTGQAKTLIAAQPLSDQLDMLGLPEGAKIEVTAQHIPRRDYWLLLNFKVVQEHDQQIA
jgi:hypothetical protein